MGPALWQIHRRIRCVMSGAQHSWHCFTWRFDNRKMAVGRIMLYSRSGQFMLVLLAALVDLSDRIPSKSEVEQHIEKQRYLKLTPELLSRAYDSKAESQWKTILAYARRNLIDRNFLEPLKVSDAWEISEKGTDRFHKFEQNFKDGKFDIARLDLLSDAFFRRMGVSPSN